MDIRYAVCSDAQAIQSVFETVVSGASVYNDAARRYNIERFSAQTLEDLIRDDPKSVAIACIDDEIAGFMITEDQDGPIWIEWIGVHPDFRGRNVAEAMVDFSLKEAAGRGSGRYWCDTRDENEPAKALFSKAGFRQLCHLPNHWHGQGYILWAIDL